MLLVRGVGNRGLTRGGVGLDPCLAESFGVDVAPGPVGRACVLQRGCRERSSSSMNRAPGRASVVSS